MQVHQFIEDLLVELIGNVGHCGQLRDAEAHPLFDVLR